MFSICKTLIEAGRTQGIEEKMGTLFIVGLITSEELTQLMIMLPQEKPQEIANTSEMEQPVEDTEILK